LLPRNSIIFGIWAKDGLTRFFSQKYSDKLGPSTRPFGYVFKVARTVADLAGEPGIRPVHVGEAIMCRMTDRFPKGGSRLD
jgi:predicted ATPase with chaperone activity